MGKLTPVKWMARVLCRVNGEFPTFASFLNRTRGDWFTFIKLLKVTNNYGIVIIAREMCHAPRPQQLYLRGALRQITLHLQKYVVHTFQLTYKAKQFSVLTIFILHIFNKISFYSLDWRCRTVSYPPAKNTVNN